MCRGPVGQVLGTAGVGDRADERARAWQQPGRAAGQREPEHPATGEPRERWLSSSVRDFAAQAAAAFTLVR